LMIVSINKYATKTNTSACTSDTGMQPKRLFLLCTDRASLPSLLQAAGPHGLPTMVSNDLELF
jgi:hypothetical protein